MGECETSDDGGGIPYPFRMRLVVYGCDLNQRYTWIVTPAPGFRAPDLLGCRDDELLPPETVADLIGLKQRALDTGQGQSGEITIQLPGECRIYDVIAEPVRSAEGQLVGLTVAAIDLTDRRQAEEALRHSEARLALATAAAEVGVWDWDLATNRIVYSTRAKMVCGLPLEQEVTYEDLSRLTHPDDLPSASAQVRRALDPAIRDRSPYEYRVVRPTGDVRWVMAYGEAVFAQVEGQTRAIRYVGTIQDITARRRLEQVERATAQRLRLALDAGRMAVWEVDLTQDTLTTSPELNRLLGYPDDATPSLQEVRARYYPGEGERLREIGRAALARGERFFEAEFRHVWPSGQVRWLMMRGEVHFGPAGQPAKVFGVLTDVSERRHTEDALAASRERLRLGLTAGRMVAWELDLEAGSATCSANADEIFGPGAGLDEIATRMPEEDVQADRGRLEAAIAGETEIYDSEFRYQHPDGRWLWLHNKGLVARDDSGHARRVHGVCIDITARKTDQEALHEETRALDILNRTGGRVAAELDLDKLVQLVVDAGVALTGAQFGAFFYNVVDGSGESYMLYALSGAQREAFAKFPKPRNTAVFGPTFRGESVVRSGDITKDPRYGRNPPHAGQPAGHLPVRSYLAVPVVSRSGEVIGGLLFGHEESDVFTDRAERLMTGLGAQAAVGIDNARLIQDVQRLNQRLETRIAERTAERDRLWELSEDLLLHTDYEGRLLRMSPSWQRTLGDSLVAATSLHYQSLVHAEDWGSVSAAFEAVRARGKPVQFENRIRAANGSWRCIAWQFSPDPGGEYLYGVGRDVTAERAREAALRQTEEALRQAQKMEAIGQLTGGIAHDFNNLLTGIAGNLELLNIRLTQGQTAEMGRYANAAMTSVTRAAALTHRLLAFARRQTLDPKPTNLNKLVAGMEDLIRRTVGPAIFVETVMAAGQWPTLCDANQLESALLNLCINARDAMPEGGRLTIETANAFLDDAYVATERDVRPGQYVSLSVSDTGTGMTPDVLARAFEPFYTTKPIGQGTGLGLSMLYGFIKQSGGHVRIYSEMGQGTTVRLYLPRHYSEPQEQDAVRETLTNTAAPTPIRTGETVLVVEDEAVVRALVLEVLEDLGYAAIEAADGPSGLQVVHSTARIDLLVTDVGLPGLNGRQLADAARERRPGLKVLFITGYAHNAAIGSGVLPPGMEVVAKPFALGTLGMKIRSMIGGHQGNSAASTPPAIRSDKQN